MTTFIPDIAVCDNPLIKQDFYGTVAWQGVGGKIDGLIASDAVIAPIQ
ncbi:hypothetical protein [Yoonia sp. BS5-3]|uniref:Uncharacterized protein n=1 Tax=Yoonia phaeophyticola TaxID=3137369 RepID=A0ABZ2V5H3_9RHOB